MKKTILVTRSSVHLGFDDDGLVCETFPDGEVSVVLKRSVKNKDVFIVGSTEPPTENLVELLLTIETARQCGAKNICVVIPYFGYGKSDTEKVKWQSVGARVMAQLIETVGGKNLSIITIDLHSDKVVNYFSVPVHQISLIGELSKYFKDINNLVVVSPDEGGVKRTKEFARYLGGNEIVTIGKNRISPTKVKVLKISGDVAGKNVVLVDDMVQSGSTILAAAKVLRKNKAKDVFVAVVHMDYMGGGWEKMDSSGLIKKIITTDSIKPKNGLSRKFEIVSVAPVLKKAISSCYNLTTTKFFRAQI